MLRGVGQVSHAKIIAESAHRSQYIFLSPVLVAGTVLW